MNSFLEKFINKKFKTPGLALDLGCGKGFDVACLKLLGWKAYGVDKEEANLNKYYKSNKKFNLVYSNYVLQFISNKHVFIKSCFNNLKNDGWLFIHTFSRNDKVFKNKGLNKNEILKLLKEHFKNISIVELRVYDNEHKHWHKILEVTAQKI